MTTTKTSCSSCRVIDFSEASSSILNPLSRAVRTFLVQELKAASRDPAVRSIVVTGGSFHFSAGADLTEFAEFQKQQSDGPTLIDVVQAIEDCEKPVVAAIAGTCLGGGLEVTLACHYRVCTSTAKLGLPEVHVGVIPGAGGTQRLPKLIGLEQALEMILTGSSVGGNKAMKLGLVDAVVQDKNELQVVAKKWAFWAEVMPLEDRRVGRKKVKESPAQAHVTLHMASLQLPPTEKGGEGMLAALEAIRAACTLPLRQGMQVEAEKFIQVLTSSQGQARRHAFFAVRQAQKMLQQPDKSHLLLQKSVKNVQVAVIGAGTMGSGIAMVLLQAGFQVHLADISKPALDKGMAFLHKTIESQVKRQKMKPAVAAQLQSNLKATQNLEDLSRCQLVVEAVVENMNIKQKIFATLNRVTPKSAILLSNTSTLDIDQMASVLDAPRRKQFAGWHFFSPAHIMKLVEIVRGKDTSPETVALMQTLTKRVNKIGVVVGNCDGFCGNRLLKPYSAETAMLLVEGASSIEGVDRAFVNFGMALGPFQMGDLAGNDVGYYIRVERGWARRKLTDPEPPNRPARYTELADVMVSEFGRLGQKAGKGWYDYDPAIGKGRKPLSSREMADLVQLYKTTLNSQQTQMTEKEIIERVLYPLVNEGFKCLEEGIARCPSDIDVVYLYGYGWPAWRGGPMHWADNEIGLPTLLSKLQDFSQQFPETEHYVPSKLLEHCVQQGVTVEGYYRHGMHKQRSRL